MNQEKVNEIMEMFPAQKPVCFNYQGARTIVMELLGELRANRILNLIISLRREKTLETDVWVNMFRIRNDVEDPQKVFRAAITKFCESDEGARMVSGAGGSPNWGDISSENIDDFLYGCGFYPFGESIDIFVDHDEIVYTAEIDGE